MATLTKGTKQRRVSEDVRKLDPCTSQVGEAQYSVSSGRVHETPAPPSTPPLGVWLTEAKAGPTQVQITASLKFSFQTLKMDTDILLKSRLRRKAWWIQNSAIG
jgi:hypothetical protein